MKENKDSLNFDKVKKAVLSVLDATLPSYEIDTSKEKNIETPVIKSFDEDKMLFTAVVLRPNVEDSQGDIYDEDVVMKACHDYNEFCSQGNLQHLVQTELVTPVESWVAKSDAILGDGEVLIGDWVMPVKVKDEEIWKMCKDGSFTGFSVGCSATVEEI